MFFFEKLCNKLGALVKVTYFWTFWTKNVFIWYDSKKVYVVYLDRRCKSTKNKFVKSLI